MKHTNTKDTPMTTSTEIAQKIDLGFDYVNLIGFSNEDELKNEYGEEFYKKFVKVFSKSNDSLLKGRYYINKYIHDMELYGIVHMRWN